MCDVSFPKEEGGGLTGMEGEETSTEGTQAMYIQNVTSKATSFGVVEVDVE